MRTQAFPPPYKGQRDDIPLAALEFPYAERVLNFNLDTGVPTLRKGDSLHSIDAGAPPTSAAEFIFLAKWGVGSSTLMFGVHQDTVDFNVYDITTPGAPVLAFTAAGNRTIYADSITFKSYLFIFNGWTNNVYYYNGAWGGPAYTFSGGFRPFGGCVYKNRVYMRSLAGPKYCYSEIDAITGATTDVDLSTVASRDGMIVGIKPVSLSQGIAQETVLAFIFSSGEILVYAGSYPNSSDWRLMGTFAVDSPATSKPFIEAKGDVFVITETGLISLRTLFTQGVDLATTPALSAPIANRWAQMLGDQSGIASYPVFAAGVYDQLKNRLVIFIGGYKNPDGSVFLSAMSRFVYSFKTGSWYEHLMGNEGGSKHFRGGVLYNDGDIYYTFLGYFRVAKTEGASDYIDEETSGVGDPIIYNLKTAPFYSENFGSNATVGVEMLSTTDLHAQTEYTFVSNLGQASTTAQKLPNQGTGVQNPLLNIGIDANYVQLEISGSSSTSSTLGMQIYAFNLWSNKGGVR